MKILTEPTIREFDTGFGDKPLVIKEFRAAEPVPHINSGPSADGGPLIADTQTLHTYYQFEHGGMQVIRSVKVLSEGVEEIGPVFSLKIQTSDEYGYQREFSLEMRRSYDPKSKRSTFHWEANSYLHPYHSVDQIQKVTRNVALRFIDRLIDLVENHPSLVFNNSGFTAHNPPRYRPRHDGFVVWHTHLVHGAAVSVKLLD